MTILVIIIALALGLFAWKFVAVRFGDRHVGVGMLCAALCAALLTFVVISNLYDHLLQAAHGDHNWGSNGLVRGVLVLGASVVVGYWMWVFYRSRYRH
jgi:hypothetical protein